MFRFRAKADYQKSLVIKPRSVAFERLRQEVIVLMQKREEILREATQAVSFALSPG